MKFIKKLITGAIIWSILFLDIIPLCAETKEDVMKAVDKAVAIIETQGEAGLARVGKIRFGNNNYVFVNDFSGFNLMHIKRYFVGKDLSEITDDTGKHFFRDFCEVAKRSQAIRNGIAYYNGSGWVRYRWPKEGEDVYSPKTTYIRGCLMGSRNVYVGAGIHE